MSTRRHLFPSIWVLLTTIAVAVSGCDKDKHVVPAASPSVSPSSSASATSSATPTPAPTISAGNVYAQTSFPIMAAGDSVVLSSGGFSSTFAYPANNASGTDAASLVIDSNPPVAVPSPAPTGTPLLYFLFLTSTDITFGSPVGVTSLTLPDSVPTSGIAFAEMLYDTGAGAQIGSTVTGTVAGQTVTFPSVGSASFPAAGADGYLIVVSTSTSTSTGTSTTIRRTHS